MNHYVDITVNPTSNMQINVAMNKIYSQLHARLYDLRSDDIGVSFPRYWVVPGDCVRLHGSLKALTTLQATNWLGTLINHCDVGAILPIPENIHHRTVSRQQVKMSEARLRRLIKRGTIAESEVKGYRIKMFQQGLDNAYFELESVSNGQKYRRYIQLGALRSVPATGKFDAFGLSSSATIPWF